MGYGMKFRQEILDPGALKEFESLIAYLQRTQISGLSNHVTDFSNPHQVTATQIGALLATRVSSGVYTPTLTSTTNVASATAYSTHYQRIDGFMTVGGKVDVTASGAGAVELQLSLPTASNFTATEELAGAASTVASVSAALAADASTNRASLRYTAPDANARTFYFTFSYQIL